MYHMVHMSGLLDTARIFCQTAFYMMTPQTAAVVYTMTAEDILGSKEEKGAWVNAGVSSMRYWDGCFEQMQFSLPLIVLYIPLNIAQHLIQHAEVKADFAVFFVNSIFCYVKCKFTYIYL